MTEQPLRAPERSSLRQAIDAHLGSQQVSRVIYGSIIGLALILVLEAHPPGAGVVVGSLLATALAVAFAELYSEIIGTETRTRRRIKRAQVAHMLDDALAVAFGIAFPSVFFVVAALGAFEVETAFTLAKWSGLGLIGAYGFFAARFAGAGRIPALVHAFAVAGAGLVLIAVKALLH